MGPDFGKRAFPLFVANVKFCEAQSVCVCAEPTGVYKTLHSRDVSAASKKYGKRAYLFWPNSASILAAEYAPRGH